jgi:NAD dependent epimerase/dehydratase
VSSLAGRTVLVTGADGFIGSHLVARLLADGALVRGLCVYNSNGSAGWLDSLAADRPDGLDIRLGDIRDEGFVLDLVRGCDVVLHLAALIAIPDSYIAPGSFVDTNVRGTLNVLEAVRRNGGGIKLVNTSTSEVYGTPHTVPITEGHALQAQSPYAATKVAADQMCAAYAASYDLDVCILRPFNTFGPRQSLRAVIPTVLAQLLARAETLRVGSVHPRRDFTYVGDTVDGFVRAAVADTPPGEVIQLGTGVAVSVQELIGLCEEVVGYRAPIVSDDQRIRPEGSEVQVLLSDPSRARAKLGWAPTTSLADGLRETAAWLAGRIDVDTATRYHR